MMLRYTFSLALLLFILMNNMLPAQGVPKEYAAGIRNLPPKQKIDFIDSIAHDIRKSDPARSVYLLKVAIRLSIDLKIDTAEIQERMNLNRQYRYSGENDSALYQIDTALSIAENDELIEWKGEILSIKGVLLARSGAYVEATNVFLEGIRITDSIGDTATLAQLNKNWAMVYFYTQDFNTAIERTQRALYLFQLLKDTSSIATATDNIGLYYSNQEKWDSALVYQMKARDMFVALNDSSELMICYNNMASTLMSLGRFDEAESNLNISMQMAERRQDYYQMMTTGHTFVQLYEWKNDQKRVQESAARVFELATKLNNDFYMQSSSLELATSFYKDKAFEKSAFYYCISDSLRQIIYDSEMTKAAAEANQKYESAERKREIAILQADNNAKAAQTERDNLIKWAIGILAVVLLLFSAFIFRNYSRKKKDNLLLQDKNAAIETQKAVIEEANKEITDSINYAMRIQNAVLPTDEKLSSLFPQNFVYYRPRDIISGDFYWAAEGRNGVRYLAVADCTGHGVPGAMMSMLGTSILNRMIARKNVTGPGKILDALHEELLHTLNATKDSRKVNDGMDIALLMFEPENNKLTIASADRIVYLVQNGEMSSIAGDKISIGSSLPKTSPYTEHVVQVNAGLSVFLLTDGIVDQFGGPERKKFMSKRLKNLIQESSASPLKERGEIFTQAFDQWKSGMEQTDDMTLINVVFN